MKMLDPESSMTDKLRAFWKWLAYGRYKIKDKRGQIVSFKPNPVQKRLFQDMLAAAGLNQPIRIVVLKARKEGVSTFVQLLNAFLAQHVPHWKCRTIAHTDDSTYDIHEISERVFRLYAGDPPPMNIGNPLKWEHDSDITTRTAGGLHVSSGANINSLHLSELAKWQNTRMPIKDQLASILQSVPENPNTIIIIESTASMRDVSGEFKGRWDAAMQPGSPYIPFFSPWTEDPTYKVNGAWIKDLTEYEQHLIDNGSVMVGMKGAKKIKCGHDKIAWWRNKLRGDFANDEVYAKQEYPSTPEEAFQCATGRVYPMLTEERHVAKVDPASFIQTGHGLYRAIDFGAVDAFVCLWLAHLPGAPGFSVDKELCPHTWDELTLYHYDDYGKPADVNNHTCDALRYCVMHYTLTGHVHVYREMYIPNAAARGLSILDHAKDIIEWTGTEPIIGTVCDRSQPGSIQLMIQQGLYCEANRVPERHSERGEILDGCAQLQAMMIASLPLQYPPDPPPWQHLLITSSEELGVDAGFTSSEMVVAMNRYAQEQGSRYDDIFGAF